MDKKPLMIGGLLGALILIVIVARFVSSNSEAVTPAAKQAPAAQTTAPTQPATKEPAPAAAPATAPAPQGSANVATQETPKPAKSKGGIKGESASDTPELDKLIARTNQLLKK